MNTDDVLRIIEGIRARLKKKSSNIKPLKFIKSKGSITIYSDDVFTDEDISNNDNLYHIFMHIYPSNTVLSNFRKYTEEGSITAEQQMNMIFDIARICGSETIELTDAAETKYHKKYYNISLYNIFSGKAPYYTKYGFVAGLILPRYDHDKFATYAKELLKVLLEYKKKSDVIFYASFTNQTRKYQYSNERLLTLILFCKAVINNEIDKMTYLFYNYYRVLPKMAKRNGKIIFKNNAIEPFKTYMFSEHTYKKKLI